MLGSIPSNGWNKIGLEVLAKFAIIFDRNVMVTILFTLGSISKSTIPFFGNPPPRAVSNPWYPLVTYRSSETEVTIGSVLLLYETVKSEVILNSVGRYGL